MIVDSPNRKNLKLFQIVKPINQLSLFDINVYSNMYYTQHNPNILWVAIDEIHSHSDMFECLNFKLKTESPLKSITKDSSQIGRHSKAELDSNFVSRMDPNTEHKITPHLNSLITVINFHFFFPINSPFPSPSIFNKSNPIPQFPSRNEIEFTGRLVGKRLLCERIETDL